MRDTKRCLRAKIQKHARVTNFLSNKFEFSHRPWDAESYLKRDFATSVLLWIANFFRIPFLWNTYWWLLLDMQKFTHVQIIVEILRRKWSNNEKPLKINWRLMLQNYVNYKMSNRLIKSHTWELCFFTSINFEICEAFVFVIISSIKKWRIKS